MSDAVPTRRGSPHMQNGYMEMMEHHHLSNHANHPTSRECPYHQSTSGKEWRPGDREDNEHHQGNLERPTLEPGPGSGTRGSPAPGDGAMGLNGDVWGSSMSRGVASAMVQRGDAQSANRDEGFVGNGGFASASEKRNHPEIIEAGKEDLQKVKQKDFLKVVDKVNTFSSRHLSDSSNSTCSSDCGAGCKLELKELYRENAGLRLRVKAIDTIRELHQKMQKELETERDKNAKLDIAICNLQDRLHRFGCDSSVDLPKDDIFLPGHDRAFVNSLISENGKLLKELNDLKKNGEVVKTKIEVELEQQLREAKDQLETYEADIADLKAFLRSSDDAKTAKIVHLEDACRSSHKELQDTEEMCRVLTEETKKLQTELSSTQQQLGNSRKELADWKEKALNLDTKVLDVSMQKMAVHKESNLSLADQLKICEGQRDQLEKESSRLTDQLREVIAMNTRWQRYNEQRETHVLKLTKTNQHQQSKITVLEQQKRDLEQTINGLNAMLQKLKEEQRKNTDAAILALEHQVSQRDDRISELGEELSALKMYIQSSEDRKGAGQRPEDRERIQLLEQQVKTYKDDFQQERKDRERMQTNNEVLRHRLQDATLKLAVFEQENARMPPPFKANLSGSAPVYQEPRRLIARGISRPQHATSEERYHFSDLQTDAVDEIDGTNSSAEPLQCPRCTQEFTVADHSLFMRHVGICLDQ